MRLTLLHNSSSSLDTNLGCRNGRHIWDHANGYSPFASEVVSKDIKRLRIDKLEIETERFGGITFHEVSGSSLSDVEFLGMP
jgi:hypothetical protein